MAHKFQGFFFDDVNNSNKIVVFFKVPGEEIALGNRFINKANSHSFIFLIYIHGKKKIVRKYVVHTLQPYNTSLFRDFLHPVSYISQTKWSKEPGFKNLQCVRKTLWVCLQAMIM